MNLSKLFEKQRELDERIVKEKGLEGQDLLPKKILALQVELGELANEWRGFKFWSEDQEPRISKFKKVKEGHVKEYNPLLEEYVDCLHFILSIGLDMRIKETLSSKSITKDIQLLFAKLNKRFSDMWWDYNDGNYEECKLSWLFSVSDYLRLGEMLGFTWEQIEQAYHSKHEVNHKRLESGY